MFRLTRCPGVFQWTGGYGCFKGLGGIQCFTVNICCVVDVAFLSTLYILNLGKQFGRICSSKIFFFYF